MFIDSHCHLNFTCFDTHRDMLLKDLRYAKVSKLIIPATHRNEWSNIIRLGESHANIFYSLGYHPHFLEHYKEGDLEYLQQLLTNKAPQCVALGEIGLDKRAKADSSIQERVFIEQVKMAQKLQLPIILHVVQKQGRVLEILKQLKFTQGGVYHAFSGSKEVALEYIRLGFKIAVGGVITYPNSIKTRETIALLPIESLVLETDAPDMPIYQQLEKDNSPINLLKIFSTLVELRDEEKGCLATQLYNNTVSIFSLNND